MLKLTIYFKYMLTKIIKSKSRADVPGWVLVVLIVIYMK